MPHKFNRDRVQRTTSQFNVVDYEQSNFNSSDNLHHRRSSVDPVLLNRHIQSVITIERNRLNFKSWRFKRSTEIPNNILGRVPLIYHSNRIVHKRIHFDVASNFTAVQSRNQESTQRVLVGSLNETERTEFPSGAVHQVVCKVSPVELSNTLSFGNSPRAGISHHSTPSRSKRNRYCVVVHRPELYIIHRSRVSFSTESPRRISMLHSVPPRSCASNRLESVPSGAFTP